VSEAGALNKRVLAVGSSIDHELMVDAWLTTTIDRAVESISARDDEGCFFTMLSEIEHGAFNWLEYSRGDLELVHW